MREILIDQYGDIYHSYNGVTVKIPVANRRRIISLFWDKLVIVELVERGIVESVR